MQLAQRLVRKGVLAESDLARVAQRHGSEVLLLDHPHNAVTTNPAEASGLGLAIAARAGAVISDPEFVQFHPTAIMAGRDPAPLATEALRGEGAILVNEAGERFMAKLHSLAELAPRDIVARGVFAEIAAGPREGRDLDSPEDLLPDFGE